MENEVVQLYLDDIIPNRFQPREVFDDQALKELAVSIREHGVIQPIIVRKIGDKYEIIAGERRYKASSMAGLTKIPAIVRNLDDKESSKVALIENLQRRDLSPVEEARTYQKILDLDNMTQEELAKTMGKSQSAVSNKLRLLTLPDEIIDALLKNEISERHARCLLNLENKGQQIELLKKIINNKMTVRDVESEIKQLVGDEGSSEGDGELQKDLPFFGNPSINNPTSVDVDLIRKQSMDITSAMSPQKMNVEELLKPNTMVTPQQPVSQTSNISQIANNSTNVPFASPLNSNSMSELNGYGKPSLYVPNTVEEEKKNEPFVLDLDNVKAPVPFTIPNKTESEVVPEENTNTLPPTMATPGMGPKHAIELIRAAVDNAKNDGYKLTTQEIDLFDSYQFIIKIDKN